MRGSRDVSLFRAAAALVLAMLASGPVCAQRGAAVSPRNASYSIDVRLDAEQRTLHGRQLVRWRNIADRATSELWFHLYWNAWRNDASSWMREARLGWPDAALRQRESGDWGWIEVEQAVLRGVGPEATGAEALYVDLLPWARFEAPDDGNREDRTVFVLRLPRVVRPGESVEVELHFRAQIPRTVARTGFRGEHYMIAHWFPQLGVLEADGWNCHQFHAATEFFADYGVYDVRITVPRGYLVGATGQEIGRSPREQETTHAYRAADVHGFAWTASPDFLEREERFDEPGLPPVELRLLVQPEHQGQAERYFEATKVALRSLGRWYGPYPYGQLTLVDPAWGSRTGGMEYPTLFTGGTRKFAPQGGGMPEGVTIHETAHQFWYGLVGNNEFEAAWLDEGLVTYSTMRALEQAYPPRVLVRRYLPLPGGSSRDPGAFALRFPEIELDRWSGLMRGYRSKPVTSAPTEATYLHFPAAARAVSYGKTSLWLLTLERYLGWETLQRILSTFFERYRFDHPTPDDFLAVVDEVADVDLGWFFDQVLGDDVTFDYGVASATSRPVSAEGWVERDGELVYQGPPEDPDAAALHRSEVVVRRYGGGWFPVDVLLVFEDGHQIRRRWDGRARWWRFEVEHPARLAYAEIDPDDLLMLDVRRINNSRQREPQARLPAVKWGSKWMIWLQDFLATFTFFV
jgi:hypothetical protein